MLTAIRNNDGKRVIGDLIEKNQEHQYFCDYCNEQVIHHKSDARLKIGHFKHKASEFCPNISKGESETHLKMKMQMYQWLHTDNRITNIELEKWLCDKKVRADVYFEYSNEDYNRKVVFECQASYITLDEIKRRTNIYNSNGYTQYWFFPFDKLIRWMYNRSLKEPFTVNIMKFKAGEIYSTDDFNLGVLYWNYDYPKFPIKEVILEPYFYREKFTDRMVQAKTKFEITFYNINTPFELLEP